MTVVRAITAAEHVRFLEKQPSASFLQTPAWGLVKSEWGHESIGWFRGTDLIGAGLVLYRRLPWVDRSLAYLPEGPVLDWGSADLDDLLAAMAGYLREKRAFAIRMGPPVPVRRWTAATVKRAIADVAYTRLDQVPPDTREETGTAVLSTLGSGGWIQQTTDEGFSTGQPQYVFQIPLGGRSEDDVLAAMNQLWRRNIKKAAKAGVVVSQGSAADLPTFHDLYAETAARDHFIPRPAGYFGVLFEALQREDPDRIRLYLAHHDDLLVAATIWIRVGRHTWYSYGASSTDKRDVRGSNAVQWQMIRDAIATGAAVYDLRGITDTLDPEDPHVGLIQFKVGTGGEAVEYVGEWDLPLNRMLYKAFKLYLRRR
ncbi:MAG: lipid II:glycine glycyltransferase FemX [Nocardioidaceae bacterium]